ncbi:MAG TPA: SRPBCC family protein [Gemmatimonadaceae bacterium]|nr:SRPBCC family protein [Gemmatimonadaceae bacterium]
MSELARAYDLGPMPPGRQMETIDERLVRATPEQVFAVARAVEEWPAHLGHYRFVRFREKRRDGGGLVEMSAYRHFAIAGPLRLSWPTWWLSEMSVDSQKPAIRFRHVGGITKGMDVEWTFRRAPEGTQVTILHVWDGPNWPVIGMFAASFVIGPVFIHGIASRTLAGLAVVAEREAGTESSSRIV